MASGNRGKGGLEVGKIESYGILKWSPGRKKSDEALTGPSLPILVNQGYRFNQPNNPWTMVSRFSS